MGKIWSWIIILAIIYGIVTGRGSNLANALLDIPLSSFKLSITIVTAACFWSGFLYILLDVGIIDLMAKWLSPFLRIIFPKLKDKEALRYISANIAANMLGLGSASTPSGLKAMKRLQEISPLPKDVASDDMITFLVLNTAGITLIPTTVIAIRQALHANNPTDFIVVGLLATIIATIKGIIFERIIRRPYVNHNN
jgi:spore maturation protein A